MDAIQQDVDNEVVTEETPQDAPQQLSRQQEELERIAEKVGEDHETEGSFRDEDAPSIEELSNPLRNEDGIYYATAKVNGEEVDVPWDEVLAQYQKNSAADKRLQEAAERQRELEEYEAKLNAYPRTLAHLQNRYLRTRLTRYTRNTMMPFSKAMKKKQVTCLNRFAPQKSRNPRLMSQPSLKGRRPKCGKRRDRPENAVMKTVAKML